jgi:hypothetical protein
MGRIVECLEHMEGDDNWVRVSFDSCPLACGHSYTEEWVQWDEIFSKRPQIGELIRVPCWCETT